MSKVVLSVIALLQLTVCRFKPLLFVHWSNQRLIQKFFFAKLHCLFYTTELSFSCASIAITCCLCFHSLRFPLLLLVHNGIQYDCLKSHQAHFALTSFLTRYGWSFPILFAGWSLCDDHLPTVFWCSGIDEYAQCWNWVSQIQQHIWWYWQCKSSRCTFWHRPSWEFANREKWHLVS